MSAKKICANCIYSKGAATELHCRRFPPVAGEYAFLWPVVPMDGWCGEQKEKELFLIEPGKKGKVNE